MLTFKIFKKIISFSFLILILISLTIPISVKAQLINPNNPPTQSLVCFSTQYDPNDITNLVMIFPTGRWYFKVSPSDTGIIKYQGPFDDQSICEKAISNRYYYETITPANENNANTELNYYPLAPLPGVGEENCTPQCDAKGENCKKVCIKLGTQKCTTDLNTGVETCAPCTIADKGCTPGTGFAGYLNIMIQIFIGIAAVLAMIMIVMGGIEYMTTELVSTKQAGKDRIMHAILGLILALGSYAILNTLNPDLLNVNLSSLKEVTATVIDLPDAGDGTIDPDFKTGKGSYSTDMPVSAGVISAVAKIKQGWEISMFRVFAKTNRMVIQLKKGNEFDNSNIIDIRPGLNDYAENKEAKTGDAKTPKGSWKILGVTMAKDGKPIYNGSGANMGAGFWLLSPMINGERGIGMHGNKNGTLSKTKGCLRLKNADLIALAPYVKAGIPVNIGD